MNEQENRTCRGLAENGTNCRYAIQPGKNCCTKSHADMENYTEHQFNNLELCKRCPRPRWRYLGEQKMCNNCYAKYAAKICKGKRKNGASCTLTTTNNNNFCDRNHGYMNDYTNEMCNDLKKCSGCLRMIYRGHFQNNSKTCNDCQSRSGNVRKIERTKNTKSAKKKIV